ncbi:phage tail tape measure protein [Thauera phenylacetica]
MSTKQKLSLEVRLEALDKATRPMQMVGRAGQEMAKQLSIAQNQAKNLSRALADGSGTEQFKRNLEQVAARIDKLRKANDSYQRSMALRDSLANAGVKMGVAGAAMGAAAMVPVKAFAEAEDAGTQLAVSMMKAGGQVSANFEKVNELAMRLGNRLPGTTADFQNMMTVLIRQGISEQAILGGLGESAALLGVQLKMPFDQAAEFAAKLQDATRTTEGDMLALMDTIQRAYYAGTDSGNMLNAFAKLAPALDTIRMKGLDAANAMAPLLVMADQSGMDGSAAGNALRKVLQKNMDTGKIAEVMAGLNKATGAKLSLNFTDGKGEFGGLEKMFVEMAKLKNLTTETRLQVLKDLYGDDAEVMQVVSLLINKGQAGYNETLAKMQAQANLQDRVNKQLGTLRNLWDAATGTFTNALVAFGETISPELKAVTEWIGRVAEATQNWAKENPALSGGLMKIVAGGALLFTALGGIALAASALIGPFAMAKLAIGVMGGAGLKMIALSVPLLAAIGGIAWAAYEIYQNWDGIAAWFRQKWETVTSFMSGLAARFEQIGLDVMLGLSRGIRNAAGAVKDAVFSTADNVTNWFKSKLGINSPSRVFMELGGYTMAGLVQGVGKGEPGALKAIGEFSRRFATTAALGMAGAGIATAAPMPTAADRPLMTSSPRTLSDPSASFHYTINIDARGGGDEKAIRRVVQSELERQRNYLAARRRARLGDVN